MRCARARTRVIGRASGQRVALDERDRCPARYDPSRACRDRGGADDGPTRSATDHPQRLSRRRNPQSVASLRRVWSISGSLRGRIWCGGCSAEQVLGDRFPDRSRWLSGVRAGRLDPPVGPLTSSPLARLPGTRPPSNSLRQPVPRRHVAPPAGSRRSPVAPSRRRESGFFPLPRQTAAPAHLG